MVCSEWDDSSNDNLLPEEIVVHEEWNAHGERAASKAKKGVGDSQCGIGCAVLPCSGYCCMRARGTSDRGERNGFDRVLSCISASISPLVTFWGREYVERRHDGVTKV